MSFANYIEICAAIIAAYAAAVVAALLVIRRCEDGTEDEAAETAREAFRLAAAKLSVTTTFVTRTVR